MITIKKEIQNRFAFFVLLATFLGLGSLVACSSGDEDAFVAAVKVNALNITAITVTSNNTILEVGANEQYKATATINSGASADLDVTSLVHWSSSNESEVSINQSGLVTAITDGMVQISATLADLNASKILTSSSAPLTSITINNNPSSVGVCSDGYAFVANGTFQGEVGTRNISNSVSWSSDAPVIASVGDQALGDGSANDKGFVSTFTKGVATISAQKEGITSIPNAVLTVDNTLNTITLSPVNNSLLVGGSQQFMASGTYSGMTNQVDITNTVSWTSGVSGAGSPDASLLSISNTSPGKGLATAIAEGIATVTATCDAGSVDPVSSGAMDVNVNAAVTVTGIQISDGSPTVIVSLSQSTLQLTAILIMSDGSTGTDVTDEVEATWSKNRDITGTAATVSNSVGSKGEVSFTATGQTEFLVFYQKGTTASVQKTIIVKVE